MEERSVTVDGVTHDLPEPFIVIATQNPLGSVGTQQLPDSQLDRFIVRLSIGYPSHDLQVAMIRESLEAKPLDSVQEGASREDIITIQRYLANIRISEELMDYATALCEATRTAPLVQLGVSPRGVLALVRMARASAILGERDYVIPEDIRDVYKDVCAHRLILRSQARIEGVSAEEILDELLEMVPAPALGQRAQRR